MRLGRITLQFEFPIAAIRGVGTFGVGELIGSGLTKVAIECVIDYFTKVLVFLVKQILALKFVLGALLVSAGIEAIVNWSNSGNDDNGGSDGRL